MDDASRDPSQSQRLHRFDAGRRSPALPLAALAGFAHGVARAFHPVRDRPG